MKVPPGQDRKKVVDEGGDPGRERDPLKNPKAQGKKGEQKEEVLPLTFFRPKKRVGNSGR